MSGTAKITGTKETGHRVIRSGGVVQEGDKLRRENWLFLRDIESRITAHLAGNSEVSSGDLLRDRKSFPTYTTPFPRIPSHMSTPFHLQTPFGSSHEPPDLTLIPHPPP